MADQPVPPATPAKDAAAAAPPAGATPAPEAAPPPEKDAKSAASIRAAAAKDAAKNAARAGFKAFQNVGAGAATRIKAFVLSIVGLPLLLFRGSLSTRLLTAGFLASLGVLAISGAQIYQQYVLKWAKHKAETGDSKAADGMNEFFKQQKELSIAASNVVFLERFSSSLHSESGKVEVFEVEIYLEASDPETGRLLKNRVTTVHEIVAVALQGQVYERLITEEGKVALKRQVADAIVSNGLRKWKSKGTVRRVFFTRFVMG